MTVESEGLGLRHQRARNIAEADEPEHLAFEPAQRHDRRNLPAAGLHQAIGKRNFAGEREQQRHRVVGDFAQAVVRHVGDDDPEARGGGNIDVVDAEPEPADDLAAFQLLEEFARQLRVGHEDCVSVARDREDIVGGRRFRHPQFRINSLEGRAGRIERREGAVGDGNHRGHDSTSGLTMLGGVRPAMMAMMLSTTALAIASRTSWTALPTCGVSVTLVKRANAGSILGSCSNTSRAAPAMRFSDNAASRAASSMTAPRDVLMRKAVGFMSAISRAPII